jgi:hypothetical protein
LYGFAALFKDPTFKREREWRLVSVPNPEELPGIRFRKGKSTPIPYCELPFAGPEERSFVDRVIVGPCPEPDVTRQAVESIAGKAENSKIPYRNW